MKRGHLPSGVALTVAVVLVPCGAWFLFGRAQLDREADQLREAALREAASAAEQMAGHLAVRLEELNEHESNRPHTHYWPEGVFNGDICADPARQSSPFAKGKRHKMILAHFQIDESGRITSPEPWVSIDSLDLADPAANASLLASAERARPDEDARVSPFRWQTATWEGQPTLLAVRQVLTGGKTFVQGFAVDGAGLSHWLFQHGFPAELISGEPRGQTDARIPILGAAWHIRVDPGPRLVRAQIRVAAQSRQFYQSLIGGVLFALLGGACLVILFRRSERLADERSRFAAAAAHELRTPLAGIRLHGEMLALALGNPSKVTEYARRISDEAERLTRLVANVFNYSQVDQKRLGVQKETGDLGTAVRAALAIMRPIVDRSGAQLDVHIDEDLPKVSFDKDAVHQIVRNLVDNAEKHTRRAADRRIEVEVFATSFAAAVAVRDHGPGVAQAARRRIFDPFNLVDRRGGIGGLGLGLSVVRTLALAHGGDVEYQDAPGGGARFVVAFPLPVGAPAV